MTPAPLDVARRLHAALADGQHGEALRPLFSPDARVLEHPNRIKPQGAVTDLEGLLAASSAGAALLSTQRFAERAAYQDGTTAIFKLSWSGVVAQDVGPFQAGQELRAEVAQFVRVREGRIESLETYDCYPPFEPQPPTAAEPV